MNSLLTINELSEALKISPRTIRQWTHESYIPYIKIGHSVRFDEKQIQTWLAKRSKAGRKTRRVEV